MTSKNEKLYTAEKKLYLIFDQKLQTPILGLQVTEKAVSSQKRTSSTSKHEISSFFQLFCVIFALLDLDLDFEYASASTDLIESGSNTDPDPKA